MLRGMQFTWTWPDYHARVLGRWKAKSPISDCGTSSLRPAPEIPCWDWRSFARMGGRHRYLLSPSRSVSNAFRGSASSFLARGESLDGVVGSMEVVARRRSLWTRHRSRPRRSVREPDGSRHVEKNGRRTGRNANLKRCGIRRRHVPLHLDGRGRHRRFGSACARYGRPCRAPAPRPREDEPGSVF